AASPYPAYKSTVRRPGKRSATGLFLSAPFAFLFHYVIANLFLFFNPRFAFWHAAFIKTLHKRAGR
ncbi:hypothetical protein, partial [Enterobacter roggenkampii]|uniref:hypothetical protein n=1 Tax=Enterobacter roggenkampii TaxID=1812935 RepID=UPI001E39A775